MMPIVYSTPYSVIGKDIPVLNIQWIEIYCVKYSDLPPKSEMCIIYVCIIFNSLNFLCV